MSNNKVPYTLVQLAKRDLLPAVPGRQPRQSCYKFNYVKNSHRAPHTPRTHRQFRMRHLHGLMAFYRNRFYEKDRWYKARIEKPIYYPTCYFIDPYKLTASLSERLADLEIKDPVSHPAIDIGFPLAPPELSKQSETEFASLAAIRRKNSAEIERAARLRQLRVDVDTVEKEMQMEPTLFAPSLRQMATHYGIFQDLFHPDAYFNPIVFLKVHYEDLKDSQVLNPVICGNILNPIEASNKPQIHYNAEPKSYWSLLLTNPDGNMYEENNEVVHWFVCNIPENRVNEGEMIVDYMQPLPMKGTGYHRLVFVLFRQDNGRVDFSSFRKALSSKRLDERTFHTPSFYKTFEDHITPAGLAFFQTSWDESCSRYFHEKLDMEEPIFEYDWPKPYVEPQEEFPQHTVSFHQYLDKYRDPKDIEKEIYMKRLKRISPFKNEAADKAEARRRRYFPNAFYERERRDLPTWNHLEKIRENQGVGKYKAIYENRIE